MHDRINNAILWTSYCRPRRPVLSCYGFWVTCVIILHTSVSLWWKDNYSSWTLYKCLWALPKLFFFVKDRVSQRVPCDTDHQILYCWVYNTNGTSDLMSTLWVRDIIWSFSLNVLLPFDSYEWSVDFVFLGLNPWNSPVEIWIQILDAATFQLFFAFTRVYFYYFLSLKKVLFIPTTIK